MSIQQLKTDGRSAARAEAISQMPLKRALALAVMVLDDWASRDAGELGYDDVVCRELRTAALVIRTHKAQVCPQDAPQSPLGVFSGSTVDLPTRTKKNGSQRHSEAMHPLNIYIAKNQYAALKKLAQDDISISEQIRRAIDEYLERKR